MKLKLQPSNGVSWHSSSLPSSLWMASIKSRNEPSCVMRSVSFQSRTSTGLFLTKHFSIIPLSWFRLRFLWTAVHVEGTRISWDGKGNWQRVLQRASGSVWTWRGSDGRRTGNGPSDYPAVGVHFTKWVTRHVFELSVVGFRHFI